MPHSRNPGPNAGQATGSKPPPPTTQYLKLYYKEPPPLEEEEDEDEGFHERIPPVTVVYARIARGQELWLEHPPSDGNLLDWQAQLTLIDEVIERFRTSIIGGATVLELGAGLGLPGTVCALLGANVMLTEQADMMEYLARNVYAHFFGPQKKSTGTAQARCFRWGRDGARRLAQEMEFDFILCSDCVYEPLYGQTWMDLVDSLEVLCGPDTTILVAVHRRLYDGVDRFLARLVSAPMLMTERRIKKKVDGADIEIFSVRRPRSPEMFDVRLQASFEKKPPENVLTEWRAGRPFLEEISGGS